MPGDHGARGALSGEAHTASNLLWASRHRRSLSAAAATAAGIAAIMGAHTWGRWS